MILKPGEYVDISGMTMKEAKKIFPQLKNKDWRFNYYTLMFCTKSWRSDEDIDAYSSDCDRREVWIQKELRAFNKVCLDEIGEL